MLIRDLEQKTGLDRATIRYYEREGMIAPVRQENGYREYLDSDCEMLLKVKLLRQLGMPLHRIKGLQQGSEDFSSVLDEQIDTLEKAIDSSIRAKEVCQQMRTDGTDFDSLDAQFYLTQLSQPRLVPKQFSEGLRAEKHPWRRYIARMIDLQLVYCIFQFAYVVLLRIRPVSQLVGAGLHLLALLTMIPLCAWMLHRWGTTPGKFAMGIHFEAINGGKMTFKEAFIREFHVYRFGFGWGIPFYGTWRLYQSYQDYKEYEYIDYDAQLEITFDEFKGRKKAQAFILILICILLIVGIAADSMRPVYLGEDLTASQIIENYNAYNQMNGHYTMEMEIDGSWIEGNQIIELFPAGNYQTTTFTFITEGGTVTEITYHDRWSISGENPIVTTMIPGEDITAHTAPSYLLHGRCNYMACSILAAQMNLLEDTSRLSSEITMHSNWRSYSIERKNIVVSWEISAENLDEDYRVIDKEKEAWVNFSFSIKINHQ